MLWQEKTSVDDFIVPDSVVDMSYRFDCPELPVDHAQALANSLAGALPWLGDEPLAAIHSIHGATSGNGWSRPDGQAEDVLQLPKRTRLHLRLPKHRLDDARQLEQTTHDIAGFQLRIGQANVRPLFAERNIFCRSLAGFDTDDETHFTEQVANALRSSGVRATKLLCGLNHGIHSDNGPLRARSVMLAELDLHESIWLQQNGLGEHHLLGCGIFLPHKSVAAVGGDSD